MLTIFSIGSSIFPSILSTFERVTNVSVQVIFKQRKSRQFNYKPKYQKDNSDLIDDSFHSKWEDLKKSRKRKSSIFSSPLFLVLFLIVVIILMYVLGRYQ